MAQPWLSTNSVLKFSAPLPYDEQGFTFDQEVELALASLGSLGSLDLSQSTAVNSCSNKSNLSFLSHSLPNTIFPDYLSTSLLPLPHSCINLHVKLYSTSSTTHHETILWNIWVPDFWLAAHDATHNMVHGTACDAAHDAAHSSDSATHSISVANVLVALKQYCVLASHFVLALSDPQTILATLKIGPLLGSVASFWILSSVGNVESQYLTGTPTGTLLSVTYPEPTNSLPTNSILTNSLLTDLSCNQHFILYLIQSSSASTDSAVLPEETSSPAEPPVHGNSSVLRVPRTRQGQAHTHEPYRQPSAPWPSSSSLPSLSTPPFMSH
ncbi:hypothetical protein BT96DRAFT_1004961 [Gymnopus androsaceus JB14]|uniref:Uncharacterized protein n=1 Tax=Gymnopus androsaceus JB14 TaxID=1447944 RepID=A0A6A4GPA9_9AGAR|nr:hypothetical protein BT96DRAFT_1004961 [Gymnopus androsaceus JB14]